MDSLGEFQVKISNRIEYAKLDELFLDPLNPRLGRNNSRANLPQERVLELMTEWTLDELAISYLESGGFWVQEALLVTREKLYGEDRLVVIEGNRRLAALKLLYRAYHDPTAPKKWKDIASLHDEPENLFMEIPYLFVPSRGEIEAFLGFRHVTGIKEWEPAEKAEFIAKLIDERNMSYEEVRRKIGSKTPTVRQNYITYRVLRQMEDTVESFSPDDAERRFSVMYLSLGTHGAQEYLGVDMLAAPEKAKQPIPADRVASLKHFTKWIFGNASESQPPLFTDSRDVALFGLVLDSPEAVEYLETSDHPIFDFAIQKANADIPELIHLLTQAADNLELSLSRIHLYTDNEKLTKPLYRLYAHVDQLQKTFPKK